MSLKRLWFFLARISSNEGFSRPARHLAIEFTRYAHGYPQDLWTRSWSLVQPPPANRCPTRISGVPRQSPSKAADDATAGGD